MHVFTLRWSELRPTHSPLRTFSNPHHSHLHINLSQHNYLQTTTPCIFGPQNSPPHPLSQIPSAAMEQIILQQSAQFHTAPPTIDLIHEFIANDNVLSLVATVCYALEAQTKFHGFKYGYRFGFDEIIEFLGINHGVIPLSTLYYFPFSILLEGSPELFDFFRLLRSKTNWTATSFLFEYLHSDLHLFTHKVTTTFSTLPIPDQHRMIRSRSFELAFTHGQDKLWYWLSPCDIPSKKIRDIIQLLNMSVEEYNATVHDAYVTLIDIAVSTYNFSLLYSLFARQCPRLISDDKTLDIDQDIHPIRFSFAYNYNDTAIKSTLQNELHTELSKATKDTKLTPILPTFDRDAEIGSASLLEPYIPDLCIIRAISISHPITSYCHGYQYQPKLAQLQSFISDPSLINLTAIDDLAYSNVPEKFDSEGEFTEESVLATKSTQAQKEYNFLSRYIQQQRAFFHQVLSTFGWNIWPSHIYPFLITACQCYGDEQMLRQLDQIGLNEQTMYTFYQHAHAQIPSTTYLYKDLFCTILSSAPLVDETGLNQSKSTDNGETAQIDLFSTTPTINTQQCIPYKIPHDITLTECLRLLITHELNAAIESFLQTVGKTLPELFQLSSELEEKNADLKVLPLLLRSGLNHNLIKLAMKHKVKVCSNSLKGREFNAFIALSSAAIPQNQLIQRFDSLWGYVQRNKKFKPQIDGLELIQIICEQFGHTVFYKHHSYPFPTILIDKLLSSPGLVADWSWSTTGFFRQFVRNLFGSRDAMVPKRIVSAITNFYQLPTSPQFQTKMIDLREAMHYFTITFITPEIAPKIFQEREFTQFLYYLAIVGYLPTLYYLLYDCGFVPKFEHYHALIDAASIAQPFTTEHGEFTLAKMSEPFIQAYLDEEKSEKERKISSKSPDKLTSGHESNKSILGNDVPAQLPKNLFTLAKLQKLLPKGVLNDDIVTTHEQYKSMVAVTKENFAQVDFPYAREDGKNAITRTLPETPSTGKTALIPSYIEQWTLPKHGVFHLQSLFNTTKHDITSKELSMLHQITPSNILNTVISTYFLHPRTKDPLNHHSLITWLFAFIRNDPNFPESVVPLPLDETTDPDTTTLDASTDAKSMKQSSKTKNTKTAKSTKKDDSNSPVSNKYLESLKSMPKTFRDYTHTSNSYNMMYRLVLSAGLIPFIDLFELCIFAQYNNFMFKIQEQVHLKGPEAVEIDFVPVPPVTRFSQVVELFTQDFAPVHGSFYFRRSQVLGHLLHRLFNPLIELLIEQSEAAASATPTTSTTADKSKPTTNNNNNNNNNKNNKNNRKGKSDTTNMTQDVKSTPTPTTVIDHKQLLNDCCVLINFLALYVFQDCASSANAQTGPLFPYQLMADIFNHIPGTTMSSHFLHMFLPSFPNAQQSTFLNIYDQYLGLYYEAYPDEIIEKYGYRSFLGSPSTLSTTSRSQSINTTHLRYSSPLFNPSFNDKLQPLYYLQDQPIKLYIGLLHIFMLHSIDFNSLIDTHGNSFVHFVMNSAAYQPQQQEDMRFFLDFSAKLSTMCHQIKLSQLPLLESSPIPPQSTPAADLTNKTQAAADIKAKKKKNAKNDFKPTTSATTAKAPTPGVSTPGLPESHDEIVVPSYINDIAENNFLIHYLKAQQAQFLHPQSQGQKDNETQKSSQSDDISTQNLTKTNNISTQEILTLYPQLAADFKELEDYLPNVENKLKVNTLMAAIGSNHPLSAAFSHLPGSYPLLFQKDAFGRTLLHHLCGLSSIQPNFAMETDETGTYSRIINASLTAPHRIHLEQDHILQKVIDPRSNTPYLPPVTQSPINPQSALPSPSHISTDNRLVLLTRDHVAAPIDLQPAHIQSHFKKGLSWSALNPTTHIPLSIADIIMTKQHDDEDAALYLEQIRLISLYTMSRRDENFDLTDFKTQWKIEEETNPGAMFACMQPDHATYQDFPDQSNIFDSLGVIVTSCSHLCGILNGTFDELADPKDAKELASENTTAVLKDIQIMFTRQVDGSLPMFNPIESDL